MQAAWMIAASLFFAGMSVCIKYASPYFGPLEIVCYRGAVGIVFMWALARSRRVNLATRVPLMHVWRNAVGVSALSAWFYAIAYLPLATAMTLNYMSGVWVAAFLIGGTLLTGRLAGMRRQGPLVLAVMASFAGVVMMLRPTLEQNQLFAGLVGLLSGLMSALAYIQVAALGRIGEPEARTVFYFSVGAALAGGVGMQFFHRHPLNSAHALWLLPVGVLAALGQLCMTRAYTRGATMIVANLQYSGIVFAALFGLTLFGDRIAPIGWLGMAVIVASGIAATFLRARALSNPPAEEH
ncbi:MAG: DMT family transporter [Burkholderiaceae bacterium]|jgi:S-adenosylmethionine uptake transporter|nr:DMT family transporter [Burkholderiaceae bacterium]